MRGEKKHQSIQVSLARNWKSANDFVLTIWDEEIFMKKGELLQIETTKSAFWYAKLCLYDSFFQNRQMNKWLLGWRLVQIVHFTKNCPWEPKFQVNWRQTIYKRSLKGGHRERNDCLIWTYTIRRPPCFYLSFSVRTLLYFENRVGFFFAPRTLNTLLNRCLSKPFT